MNIADYCSIFCAIACLFAYDIGKKKGYSDGHTSGYKAGLNDGYDKARENEGNHLSKDEVDMIRQVLNVMSWDGESHENKDKSK